MNPVCILVSPNAVKLAQQTTTNSIVQPTIDKAPQYTPMPIVGIVGGLGPESTIDYYRRILAAWERQSPGSSPSIVIDSLDVHTGLRLAANDHAALTEYLLASVQRLASAGVDFVAMSANTAHLVFDALEERSPVPLLSIVEVCAAKATAHHSNRLALLGTRFTILRRCMWQLSWTGWADAIPRD